METMKERFEKEFVNQDTENANDLLLDNFPVNIIGFVEQEISRATAEREKEILTKLMESVNTDDWRTLVEKEGMTPAYALSVEHVNMDIARFVNDFVEFYEPIASITEGKP